MAHVLFISLLCLCLCQVAVSTVEIQIDELLESNGMPPCRLRHRSRASNKRAVWMFETDSLTFDFCLQSNITVNIEDVSLSNDGGVDVIVFDIDGDHLGRVQSVGRSLYGKYWSDFTWLGPVGGSKHLSSGHHSLTLLVEDADLYGVELDQLRLGFGMNVTSEEIVCQQTTNVRVTEKDVMCNPWEKMKKTATSTTTTIKPTTSGHLITEPTTSGHLITEPTTRQQPTPMWSTVSTTRPLITESSYYRQEHNTMVPVDTSSVESETTGYMSTTVTGSMPTSDVPHTSVDPFSSTETVTEIKTQASDQTLSKTTAVSGTSTVNNLHVTPIGTPDSQYDSLQKLPRLPDGPTRTVILKTAQGQRITLERRTFAECICRQGFSYYNILAFGDDDEVAFTLEPPIQSVRSRFGIDRSLGLKSSIGVVHKTTDGYLKCFSADRKQMLVQTESDTTFNCSAIVIFVRIRNSRRSTPRFVLKQDGSMLFSPEQNKLSQPRYYLPPSHRDGPPQLDIHQVTIQNNGSTYELRVVDHQRTLTTVLRFDDGGTTSMTVSGVNKDSVLLSLVYPCWNRYRINTYVNVTHSQFVSLFDSWRRVEGKDIQIAEVFGRSKT